MFPSGLRFRLTWSVALVWMELDMSNQNCGRFGSSQDVPSVLSSFLDNLRSTSSVVGPHGMLPTLPYPDALTAEQTQGRRSQASCEHGEGPVVHQPATAILLGNTNTCENFAAGTTVYGEWCLPQRARQPPSALRNSNGCKRCQQCSCAGLVRRVRRSQRRMQRRQYVPGEGIFRQLAAGSRRRRHGVSDALF